MKDLLDEYGEKLYQPALDQDKNDDAENGADAEGEIDDIEKEIKAEVQEIRKPKAVRLFTPIQLNTQCGKSISIRDPRISCIPQGYVLARAGGLSRPKRDVL